MKIENFPNPKLALPKEIAEIKDDRSKNFQYIDNYHRLVGKYIYTEIQLEHKADDPLHVHAWIQRTVGAIVLRSLYIRNDFVEAFNSGNTIGMFPALKTWLETVGALAAILDLLEGNPTPAQLQERFVGHALGNRGKGNLRVGNHDAMNVLTMIEKADKYISKIRKNTSRGAEGKKIDKFFTDYYDIASNPSHPSFEAHELVGGLDEAKNGRWKAKSPQETKQLIIDELPGYGGLLMSPIFIENICKKIWEIENQQFSKLDSKKYFD